MAHPRGATWPIEPHTKAKHEILRLYLQAWISILGRQGFPSIAYIDGFAGPGSYSTGEKGSPIIALTEAFKQKEGISGAFEFLFVEADKQTVDKLKEEVSAFPAQLPPNFQVRIEPTTFEEAFNAFSARHKRQSGALPPTFAFIDPCGWTGAPFAIVSEILAHQSCEVFINIMYEEINRFLDHPDQPTNFDRLFGTDKWRECAHLEKPAERRRCLHEVYYRQLIDSARVKYVRSFEMRNKADSTDYFLFYATNSLVGLKRMKEAMWKVSPGGGFTFSDATDPNQLTLLSAEPDFFDLEQRILWRFRGTTTTIAAIEMFVVVDTPFRETHYKRQVLARLEKGASTQIEVIGADSKRKAGTFADPNMRVRFK